MANQLATKLLTAENKRATFETGDRAVLMPQLGDLWTTERTIRVVLFRGPAGDDLRYAHASTATTPGASTPALEDLPWASFDIDVSDTTHNKLTSDRRTALRCTARTCACTETMTPHRYQSHHSLHTNLRTMHTCSITSTAQ